MPTMVKPVQYEPHPQGHFIAILQSIEERESLVEGWNDQFLLKFVTDELNRNGDPLLIHHFTSQIFSPKSKLCKTICGITGKKFSDFDGEFDLDTLIGTRCSIVVKHTENKNGQTRTVIESFLPYNVDGNGAVQAPTEDDNIPF